MKLNPIYLLLLGVLSILVSCKEEEDPFPIYTYSNPIDTLFEAPDPNTIVGLHYNIFSKTCANVGCHDGTFNPDFRTISSSYNTLVNHEIVKNNDPGRFKYLVEPGNANNSMIVHRMTVDIDGMSGIMPLVVDPGNDYHDHKEDLIQNVKNWINDGAKDIFGNPRDVPNLSPGYLGVMITEKGTLNELERRSTIYEVLVDNFVTEADVYFALEDDDTAPANFTVNKLAISNNPTNFNNALNYDLEILGTPVEGIGYLQDTVKYTHKTSIKFSDFAGTELYFMRVQVKDSKPDTTNIPNINAPDYIKRYFAFSKKQN